MSFLEHRPVGITTDARTGVFHDVIASMIQLTAPLAEAFFCKANLDTVQARLSAAVLARTGRRISRQSDAAVIVGMRAVYLQSATTSGDITRDVQAMDREVVARCAASVVTNLEQYVTLWHTLSKPRQLLPPGQATSIRGEGAQQVFRGF